MIGLRDDPEAPLPPPNPTPALVARVFAEGGWLQDALRLDHRPQQEQMARAVAAAMHDDGALLFEAGTGVGKSLAYLIPGIIHAMEQSRQMIVSTHTISLQEQIETKDLPLCRRLFEAEERLRPYAKFKSAVLLGKANYLCTTRLAHALQGRQELFASAEQDRTAADCRLGPGRPRRPAARTAPGPVAGGLGGGQRRFLGLQPQELQAAEVVSTSVPGPGFGTRRSSSSTTASFSRTSARGAQGRKVVPGESCFPMTSSCSMKATPYQRWPRTTSACASAATAPTAC